MRPMTFVHGGKPWPPDTGILHVYAVPDLTRDTALAALVRDSQQALAGYPVTPVDPEWIHVTLDQVTGATAEEIPRADRDTLASALTAEMAGAEPVTVTAGSVFASEFGILCDLSPDDGILDLHEHVRRALREVRGDSACQYRWGVQHLTIAYASGHSGAGQVHQMQRLLQHVRPSHAEVHLDEVHLVDVRADHRSHRITWDYLARIPLGAR